MATCKPVSVTRHKICCAVNRMSRKTDKKSGNPLRESSPIRRSNSTAGGAAAKKTSNIVCCNGYTVIRMRKGFYLATCQRVHRICDALEGCMQESKPGGNFKQINDKRGLRMSALSHVRHGNTPKRRLLSCRVCRILQINWWRRFLVLCPKPLSLSQERQYYSSPFQ